MDYAEGWKSAEEIGVYLDKSGNEGLGNLYALSTFWKFAVYTPSYESNSKWMNLLTFSNAGKEVIQIIKDSFSIEKTADLCLALFRIFAHHELMLDWQNCDCKGIENLLRFELHESLIFLPYRFGRLLYDRFNDQYEGSRTDHLPPEEVISFLENTPKGVYQNRSFLTGPLGLLHSEEQRFIPPTLDLPLWHCSDTGCQAFHTVELLNPDIPLTDLDHRINDILEDKFGPPSEWEISLTIQYLKSRDLMSKVLRHYDLPVLIAECIIGRERCMLLEAALKSNEGNHLRQILSGSSRCKELAVGSPEELISGLSQEEQLQLILVLKDEIIIYIIDELTANKSINVSLGQIRRAKQSPPSRSLSARSELSRLGLRSILRLNSISGHPVANLVSLINRSYLENDLIGDLLWRLHTPSVVSPIEGLVNYIQHNGASKSVNDLILTSKTVTEYVCQQLFLPVESVSNSETGSVDIILWKMGFDPPQYEEFSKRFISHLDRFNEAVLSAQTDQTEDEREIIRSIGVNLFVYVEKMLDMMVSYNVWLLASDHFLDTRFEFDIVQARSKVSDILGESLDCNESTVCWNTNGENALGVLLRYMSQSIIWMESLETENRENLKRSATDIPHYAESLETRFPFNHVSLWADSDLSEFRAYLEDYKKIVTLLQQAELAFVRNGLDHMRDKKRFPSTDKMLACISRLRQAHNLGVEKRYLPMIFWLDNVLKSRFGIIEYHLRDSEGRLLVLHGPHLLLCLRKTGFSNPYIIAPGNLLGSPNAALVFVFRERTEYDEYWIDYPRRRHIQSPRSEQDDKLA
jgi:hypothetical protein